MRDGKLALITPVMTSTEGRCVAMMRWMPTARAFWARRVTESSTSFDATIIRSPNSSLMLTLYCTRSGIWGGAERGSAGTLGDSRLAVNVLAEGKGEHRRRRAEGVGVDDVAQRDELALAVGHFDADRRRAADPLDADRLRLQGQRQIVAEVH